MTKKYRDGYKAKRKGYDKARLVAFECLKAIRTQDSYANLVLPQIIKEYNLNSLDAGFATELAYGCIRYFARYDAMIAIAYTGKTKLDQDVLDILRLGAHQLFAMRVTTYAAVSESVDLARYLTSDGPSRTVNAVMRRLSEKSLEQWLELITAGKRKDQALAVEFSHPDWIVRALEEALVKNGRPEAEIAYLLQANCQTPYVTLVARQGLIHPADLAEQAQRVLHTNVAPGILSYDAVVLENGTPSKLPAVRSGQAGVQDEGSQLSAQILVEAPSAKTTGRWLDMCAGPGGKAAILACAAKEQGAFLLANELFEHRADLVEKSLKALDSSTCAVVCGDGRQIQGQFDKILLDAPCSGLGALRRRPEARWRKTVHDLAGLRLLQSQLLEHAYSLLAPGGVLAYVTCSPHIAETHVQISAFMDKNPQAQLLDAVQIAKDLVPEKQLDLGKGPYLQLWTHLHDSDAMFVALITKPVETKEN